MSEWAVNLTFGGALLLFLLCLLAGVLRGMAAGGLASGGTHPDSFFSGRPY